MIEIPMTPLEFDGIETQLRALNPGEGIQFNEISITNGDIVGDKPNRWSADYTYAGDQLTVHGHGIFVCDKVEQRIQSRLLAALDAMRTTPTP